MVISIFRICTTSKTYVRVMRTAHIPDFGAALESKAMSDISRLERDPSPKGLVDFRNKSRYHNQFFSVSPKRTKNTMARSGLTHWSNLIRKTVQDPADFHSSEDTDCIEGNSEWTAFQPGQNAGAPPSRSTPRSRERIAIGNEIRISNRPSARILAKLRLFRDDPLARSFKSNSLCLKYIEISLAIK